LNMFPGVRAWNNAVNSYYQGNYWSAGGYTVQMVGEQVVCVLSLGYSQAALAGGQVTTTVSEEATAAIATDYGVEVQSASAEAQAALEQARAGAMLYRSGEMTVSAAGEAQYWSLTNPLTPGYANAMGIPNVATNFVMVGTLAPGAAVITNEAAALGANAGGAIQIVTEPGAVTNLWFYALPK
jgi:hypothetical protein